MVRSSLRCAQLESDSSSIVSHDEVIEFNGLDAGWSTNLSDRASKSLSIGEGLTRLSNGVDDESNFSRPSSIISNRITLEVVTRGKRHSKSMLS